MKNKTQEASLSPSQRKILDVLKQHDASLDSLSKKTGYSIDGIRGRISELKNWYRYNIGKIDGKYHLYHAIKETQDWTAKEEIILIEQYPIKSVPELIKQYFPNKKSYLIYQRARELGLRKYLQHKKKPKADNWSFEQENFLRGNFFRLGIEAIVRDDLLPGKTKKQILTKVKHMGMILK